MTKYLQMKANTVQPNSLLSICFKTEVEKHVRKCL